MRISQVKLRRIGVRPQPTAFDAGPLFEGRFGILLMLCWKPVPLLQMLLLGECPTR